MNPRAAANAEIDPPPTLLQPVPEIGIDPNWLYAVVADIHEGAVMRDSAVVE
jgi:hypothetical protein